MGPQKPKGTGKLYYMGRGRRAGAEWGHLKVRKRAVMLSEG